MSKNKKKKKEEEIIQDRADKKQIKIQEMKNRRLEQTKRIDFN